MTSWDLGGEGNSFPFDRIGDKVYGMVIDLVDRQQTDMEGTATAGQPSTWPNGDPKMMSIVTLQTELRDSPTDDGKRTVPLTGSKKPESQSRMAAVIGAVKLATNGSTALQYGGYLGLAFTGEKPPAQRGLSATKLYSAIYKAPAMELDQPPKVQQAPAQGQQQGQRQSDWQSGGAGPQWAQQEPPADPWAGQQETLSQPVDNGAWGSQSQQQQQANPWAGAPTNDPWAVPQSAQQSQPPASNQQWNPAQQGNPGPSPAQGQGGPTTMAAPQQGQQPQAAQNGGQPTPPTAQQIAGLQAINIDPASVYGPDWQSKVVG
jgi:hypothetical protein